MDVQLMTARDFIRRSVGFSAAFALTTLVLIEGYVFALLQLTAAEWIGYFQLLGGLFPVLFAGTVIASKWILADVIACLRAEDEGRASAQQVRAGFRTLSNLPYAMSLSGVVWWSAGGAIVAGAMSSRFETFGSFQITVMTWAGITASFISSVFMFFTAKRLFSELRSALGRRIGDPMEREQLVPRIGIGRKLVVSVTGVTFLTVVFSLLLSLVHASRPLEQYAVDLQGRYLEARISVLRGGDPAALAEVGREAAQLGIASGLLLLDRKNGEILAGDAELLLLGEREEIDRGSAVGDSSGFDSPNTFAWRALSDEGPIVVAVLPWSAISMDASFLWTEFAVMLLVAGFLALMLSHLLSRDIGETTRKLADRVGRVAGGDLRVSEVFESEDELGRLAHSFERMSAALRETVQRVVAAADGVENTASETATVAERVSEAARLQAQGVAKTAKSMDDVIIRAAEIFGSAKALNVVVEESSSAILEMSYGETSSPRPHRCSLRWWAKCRIRSKRVSSAPGK